MPLTEDQKRRYSKQTAVEFLEGLNQYVPPLSLGTSFGAKDREAWAHARIRELADMFTFRASLDSSRVATTEPGAPPESEPLPLPAENLRPARLPKIEEQ